MGDDRGSIDRSRIERAVGEILRALGEDPEREGLRETPGRVAEAYARLFSGLRYDPARHLSVSFDESARDLVLMRDVPLLSFCIPAKQHVNCVSGTKRAAEIEVGDELWTLDKGFLARTRVARIAAHKTQNVVILRTTEGSIKLTGDHPVKTEKAWCEAADLLPGDRVEWFPPRKLCREKISAWLKIPRGCRDKTRGFRFPAVVTNSQEMTQGFLDGYVDGDGSPNGNGHRIVTANGSFARELAEYLQRPVGRGRGDLHTVHVSSRWHQPGWMGRHGFRQQSEWYVPYDSRYVEVEAVTQTPRATKPYTVYSFKCEPHPTFLVGGHLTHNCEHHLLPMIGRAHAAYLPDGRVVGFSELVRVVEGYAGRPQIQERITAQVADALYETLGSRGSVVVVEAEHTCMAATGAWRPGTVAVTSAARGVFEEDAARRSEVVALLSRGG